MAVAKKAPAKKKAVKTWMWGLDDGGYVDFADTSTYDSKDAAQKAALDSYSEYLEVQEMIVFLQVISKAQISKSITLKDIK